MRYGKNVLLAAALTLTTACGDPVEAELIEATPDFEGLSLELTGEEEALASAAVDGIETASFALRDEHVPEYLLHVRSGLRFLNSGVKSILVSLRDTVNASPGRPGPVEGSRVYGPRDIDAVTYLLTVRRVARQQGEDAGDAGVERRRYGWQLKAKPLGAEDGEYQRIMGGYLTRAIVEDAHRGKGTLGIDLDALANVDPSFAGQGELVAAFGHRDGNKVLKYRLNGFTPDAEQYEPVTAAFVGHRRASDGGTAVRLAGRRDFQHIPNNTDAKETGLLRAKYIPGVGGRAGAIAYGGDIPEGEFYAGFACWDAQEREGFKVVLKCTQSDTGHTCDQDNPAYVAGQLSNCALALRDSSGAAVADELGDRDALDADLEDGAPDADVPDLPAEQPSGD